MTSQGSNSGRRPATPSADLRGAVDLGALAAARQAREQAEERKRAQASGQGPVAVIDVTTADFRAEVVEKSFEIPVVVDLWATWCEPCKQLSPVLEKLADEAAGAWLLAKVDVDAEPDIAAAFQVQSIPTVIAMIKGQPVPMFSGALPEAQVRQVLAELLKVAAEHGVSGNLSSANQPDGGGPPEPQIDMTGGRYEAAYEAFEAGDWDAAEAAFGQVLDEAPGDEEAVAGVVRTRLMRRTDGVAADAATSAANTNPGDVDAAILAADVDLLVGRVSPAFERLIDCVRLNSGEDRDRAREHLLELFVIVGDEDPAVQPARLALANALY
ncbi:MAG: tetratricopeptide repeat protein [Candidatus Nanopelagicales bacterium]|nr:tetratricopeptide repeat protein [Candidatus Nanopelagicales bacterium]